MRRHGRFSGPATSSPVPHARHDSRPARVRRGGVAADGRGRSGFVPRETAPSRPHGMWDVVPCGDVRGPCLSRGHALRAGPRDPCVRSGVRIIGAGECDGPRGESQRLDADDEPGPSPRPPPGVPHSCGVRSPGLRDGAIGGPNLGDWLDPRPLVGEHDELHDAAHGLRRPRIAIRSNVGSSIESSLRRLARSLGTTLGCESRVRRLATRVAHEALVTFLGSDLDEITALEAALKIRETCSLPASGYHTEQFLHGPFLSIDDRESIVMLRSREDGPRSAAIARALEASRARVVTVGESARAKIRLPAMPRILRPILSIVPLQFLAYYAALARRANPDIMRTDIARLRAGVEALFH